MDPAGIKFGLSRNLLQLDGAGIVMDDLEDNGFEATAEAEDIHRRVLWDLSCNGYCLFRQTRSCEHKTRGPGHLVRDELMDTSDRFAGEVLFPVVTGSS